MRALVDDDTRELEDLLARAFADDPAWQHAFPERSAQSLRTLLPLQVRLHRGTGGEVWVEEYEGAITAVLSTTASRNRPGMVSYLKHGMVRVPWSLGLTTTRRLLEMERQRARLRVILEPQVPHPHIQYLAEDPKHRGNGLGQSLLDQWLARADPAVPISTLTTRAEHVHQLERSGFRLIGQDGIAKAFTAWMLVRSPRS